MTTTLKPSYPLKCIACSKKTMTPAFIPYTVSQNLEGTIREVHISHLPVLQCSDTDCGEIGLTLLSDQVINQAVRQAAHLFEPSKILDIVESWNITLAEVAELLNLSQDDLTSILKGTIFQTRRVDEMLHALSNSPIAVQALQKRVPLTQIPELEMLIAKDLLRRQTKHENAIYISDIHAAAAFIQHLNDPHSRLGPFSVQVLGDHYPWLIRERLPVARFLSNVEAEVAATDLNNYPHLLRACQQAVIELENSSHVVTPLGNKVQNIKETLELLKLPTTAGTGGI